MTRRKSLGSFKREYFVDKEIDFHAFEVRPGSVEILVIYMCRMNLYTSLEMSFICPQMETFGLITGSANSIFQCGY